MGHACSGLKACADAVLPSRMQGEAAVKCLVLVLIALVSKQKLQNPPSSPRDTGTPPLLPLSCPLRWQRSQAQTKCLWRALLLTGMPIKLPFLEEEPKSGNSGKTYKTRGARRGEEEGCATSETALTRARRTWQCRVLHPTSYCPIWWQVGSRLAFIYALPSSHLYRPHWILMG